LRLIALVEKILNQHIQISGNLSVAQNQILQRQIDATDAEIDRLVYELYGLTEAEIEIVKAET
jgi:hypothetical protein